MRTLSDAPGGSSGSPSLASFSSALPGTSRSIGAFLFQYDRFRDFVKRALASKQKMMVINVSVIVFSLGLIALGYFLYS